MTYSSIKEFHDSIIPRKQMDKYPKKKIVPQLLTTHPRMNVHFYGLFQCNLSADMELNRKRRNTFCIHVLYRAINLELGISEPRCECIVIHPQTLQDHGWELEIRVPDITIPMTHSQNRKLVHTWNPYTRLDTKESHWRSWNGREVLDG